MASSSPFEPSDSPDLVALVRTYLSLGAHAKRGLREAAYVARCRQAWAQIETDELYRRRFLQDEITEGGTDGPYGVAIAEIHATIDDSGTRWSVPFDYAALRKPLGKRRREFIFVYPPKAMTAEPEEPQKQTLLVGLFDVLGFESRLNACGLDEMHGRYDQLISRALTPSVAEGELSLAAGMFANEFRQGYLRLPVRFSYFSDTILLWSGLHKAFVGPFLDRCASLMCNALHSGFPLRGAVSVGEAILHRPTNTFLGMPLVEAARLEAAQDAIGVALGVSVRTITVPPDRVIRYDPPVKPNTQHLLSGVVLDWPRHWRRYHDGCLSEVLMALRTEPVEKYDNAIAFSEYSAANHDWFVAEFPDHLRSATPVEVKDEFGLGSSP